MALDRSARTRSNPKTICDRKHMLRILLITGEAPIRAQIRDTGIQVLRTDNILQIGEYDVYCGKPIRVTDETFVRRVFSNNSSSDREYPFCDGVRQRDKKFAMTGKAPRSVEHDVWIGLEAAHIFPCLGESFWSCVSVNPDDGYKVVYFGLGKLENIDWKPLDPVCRGPTDTHRVS
ncbi:hypothetical protein M422DRAFT_45891 [Sphaerobolus stellatus SS14]|nr:hypothetical protein M422DRAFT_45891 [Sphaerobolus stellatus SS14]